MNNIKKSNLWIPEIIQISRIFDVKKQKDVNKISNNGHCFWDLYKKSESNNLNDKDKDTCLPLIESRILEGYNKFFYWNRYPNMIIDLDWFDLNKIKPSNIILTREKKP